MSHIELLALLLVAHALCDYPLQGPFLSQAKSPVTPVPGFPWYQAMSAHCLIHAGAVWLITGSGVLGVLEFILHFFIDTAKCHGALTVNQDQFAHVACKVAWVLLLYWSLV